MYGRNGSNPHAGEPMPVGLGEDVLEAESLARPTEGFGTIARAVVSHDALDLHDQARIIGDDGFEEDNGAFFPLVLHYPAEGDARGVGGKRMYLWRAVDDEGVVLDLVVQARRDTGAALKLLRRLLRSNPVPPEAIVTDGLASYGAALKELNLAHRHRPGRLRENNREENSHLPIRRRERKMQGFKSAPSAQRFLTTHAAIYNAVYVQRHLVCRPTVRLFTARAMSSWRAATIAA